jgi:hypothetical protein
MFCLSSLVQVGFKRGKNYPITRLYQSLRLLKKVEGKIFPVYGTKAVEGIEV